MNKVREKIIPIIVLIVVITLLLTMVWNIPTLVEKRDTVAVNASSTVHDNNARDSLLGRIISVGDIIRQDSQVLSDQYQIEYRYNVGDTGWNRLGFNHVGDEVYEHVVPQSYNGRTTDSGKWIIDHSYYDGWGWFFYVAVPCYSIKVLDVDVTVINSVKYAGVGQEVTIETSVSRDDFAIVYGSAGQRIEPCKVNGTDNRYTFKMPCGDVTIRSHKNHNIINRNNLIGTVLTEGDSITQNADQYGQQHRMEFRPSSKSGDYWDRQMFYNAYDNSYRHDVSSSYCFYSTDSKQWIVLYNYQNEGEEICYFVSVPYYKITAEDGIVVEKADEIDNSVKKVIEGAGVEEKIYITTEAPKESISVTYGDANTPIEIYKEEGTDNQYYFDMPTGNVNIVINPIPMQVTSQGYSGNYDGNAHGITVEAIDGAQVTYGTTEGNYNISTSPTLTNAGTLQVYYQVKKFGYTTYTGRESINIQKIEQNQPINIDKTDETIFGKADGTITGVDSTMEYRKEGESTYKAIQGTKIEELAPGKYYVRVKGDINHIPSVDKEVIIEEGRMLMVTLKVDGVVIATIEVAYGADLERPTIPEKEGYTNTPPTWDNDGKNITEDIEINAVYTVNVYTITFVDENGVYRTMTYEHGETVDMPKPPVKEGYTVKWETTIDKATGDAVVKAVYDENPIKVTSEADTGDVLNLDFWMVIACVSAGLLCGIIILKKKTV